MVDGVDCQAALRPRVERWLAELQELRDEGHDVRHQIEALSVIRLAVNCDWFRDGCSQIAAGGS